MVYSMPRQRYSMYPQLVQGMLEIHTASSLYCREIHIHKIQFILYTVVTFTRLLVQYTSGHIRGGVSRFYYA